jgi:antitoxin VapB
MAMNIKNHETEQLTRRLATLTGESLTVAVTTSVRERLERLDCVEQDDYVERIMAIAKATAPLFVPPYDSIDHGDLLYDEFGSPK